MTPEWIYFAKCGNFVKIGVTGAPRLRMLQLQMSNPLPIELQLLIRGDRSRELEIHAQLSALRQRGEWYRIERPLLRLIRQLRPVDESHLADDIDWSRRRARNSQNFSAATNVRQEDHD